MTRHADSIVKAEVIRTGDRYGVFACRPIAKEEPIFKLEGEVVDSPTRYSVQISETKHLEPYGPGSGLPVLVRFLNHSCHPSAVVRFSDLSLLASRDLNPGDEINFNYNATEFEIFFPFDCDCGAENCAGRIRGFRYLSEGNRANLMDVLAPHLRNRL